jgi:hypothetical protein
MPSSRRCGFSAKAEKERAIVPEYKVVNKGNRHLLEADAEKIVAMIVAGDRTLSGTAKQYHVATDTFYKFWAAHTTPEQRAAYLQLVAERRLTYNRKCRFKKGHVPWTKGLKGLHLSPRTEFKPGHPLTGIALARLGKIGSIRIRRDKPTGPKGIRRLRRFVKVRCDGPPKGQWISLARHLWQQAHGPIPPGMWVIYINGHTLDDRLENYRLASPAAALAHHLSISTEMCERFAAGRRKAMAERWAGHKPARRHVDVRRAIRRERMNAIHIRECVACGWSPEAGTRPPRCPKCGCTVFETVSVDESGSHKGL